MDLVLSNLRLAMPRAGGAAYGTVDADAVGFRDGRIAWIGASREAPAAA